jgi:hypothetical protein
LRVNQLFDRDSTQTDGHRYNQPLQSVRERSPDTVGACGEFLEDLGKPSLTRQLH